MGKEVSAALGTQRQFAKQPELPYRLRLQNPHFTTPDLTKRLAAETQNLARSLGAVVGTGRDVLGLNPEVEARKKQQAETLFNAEKEVAGLTKEGIASFNRKAALQNQSGKYDFTHNKYAMALLEEALGRAAAYSAKVDWANDPNNLHPESVEKSVSAYNDFLRQRYSEMNVNVKNQVAFDKGFWRGTMDGTYKVANEAETRINDDARYKMLSMADVEIQDAITNPALQGEDFKTQIHMSMRKMQYACRTPQDFMQAIQPSLKMTSELDATTDRLNSILDFDYQGTPMRNMINAYPYYKKIAQNFDLRVTDDIYEKAKRPDGTLDLGLANKLLDELPSEFVGGRGIPNHMLPIASGNFDKLSPKMKGSLGLIGGALYSLGYSNAQFTSGWRSPEHNAAVNGHPNSHHLYGEAVDIDLGTEIDGDQKDQLESYFKQYFGRVLFHDAGTGDHLHLAEYKGGMESADSKESSAAVYEPKRVKNIRQQLMARHNDAMRIKRQQIQDTKEQVSLAVLTAENQEDALAAIRDSGLPAQIQNTMIRAVNAKWKKEAKANKEGMSLTQQVWYNYEKGKGRGTLIDDWRIMQEYKAACDNPNYDEDAFEKLQAKADIACDRINRYWEFSSGGAYEYDRDSKTSSEDTNYTPSNPTPSQQEKDIEDIKNWIASNPKKKDGTPFTRDELENRLYRIAHEMNISPQALIAKVMPPEDEE